LEEVLCLKRLVATILTGLLGYVRRDINTGTDCLRRLQTTNTLKRLLLQRRERSRTLAPKGLVFNLRSSLPALK
jgi:hypothetical protein